MAKWDINKTVEHFVVLNIIRIFTLQEPAKPLNNAYWWVIFKLYFLGQISYITFFQANIVNLNTFFQANTLFQC